MSFREEFDAARRGMKEGAREEWQHYQDQVNYLREQLDEAELEISSQGEYNRQLEHKITHLEGEVTRLEDLIGGIRRMTDEA